MCSRPIIRGLSYWTALGCGEGRILINMQLLKLSPLSVNREDRIRVGAVMYYLGWQRRLLRFNDRERRARFHARPSD
jgi:hypothetical protein